MTRSTTRPARARILGTVLSIATWMVMAMPCVAEEVVSLILKDGGKKVVGAILSETDRSLELRLADGSRRTVQFSDLKDFFFGATEADDEEDDEGLGKPKVIYDEDDIPRRRSGDEAPGGRRPRKPKAPKPPPPPREQQVRD